MSFLFNCPINIGACLSLFVKPERSENVVFERLNAYKYGLKLNILLDSSKYIHIIQ